MKVKIKTAFKNKSLKLPERAYDLDSGLDVQADLEKAIAVMPQQAVTVPTGLYMALPKTTETTDYTWEVAVCPRSGLAKDKTLTVLNAPGTIDAGYRGELGVILYNGGTVPVEVKPGDKIAQIKLYRSYRIEWEPVDSLDESERSAKGYGSSDENRKLSPKQPKPTKKVSVRPASKGS
jgi:dUTP pyrophosphatase